MAADACGQDTGKPDVIGEMEMVYDDRASMATAIRLYRWPLMMATIALDRIVRRRFPTEWPGVT
ncbi:MAG: hypothetical protein OXP36_09415 [Gammaproteobacteria bacterium]|nr:hypothetical protein [Gammaproteobacteria bacterium]